MRFTIPFLLLTSLWTMSNVKWGKNFWTTVIQSDGKGYYAYLPATFIYHDLHFTFFDSIEKKYYSPATYYDYRTSVNGITIDKYFCGVSVMQSPFFLLGHLTAKINGGAMDGYSKTYVIWICIGALFWLWFGLHHLKKFLRMHGASEGQAAFIIAVIYLGTNLFYYTVFEPCMSHLYSFALVAAFLVYGKLWIDTNDRRAAVKIAFLLGMIILVRPVNGFIALWLIFEAKGFLSLVRKKIDLFRSPEIATARYLFFLVPLLVQLIIWKIQTGNFFVNSYGTETFHLAHPQFCDFLFSYKKGLFVYLPITFLCSFGLIPLWMKNKFRAMAAFFFLFMLIWILSSWWQWFYGGSFGTRVIIEYLPVFALLLFYLLDAMKKKPAKILLTSFIIVLALFCQFQTAQYRFLVIHWSDMNKEKYWNVFMDTKFLTK